MNLTCNGSWVNITSFSTNEPNQSVSGNHSSCPSASLQSAPPVNPYEDFYKAAFGSSIFIIVVSLTTILANSVLLFVFYVDPQKMFRNPTTFFLIGLAIVDILTALVQEPIYATCFMLLYFQHPSTKKCVPFLDTGRYFGAFAMTASFLIVLVFTVTQYIVISSPLKYGRMVTKKKVLISVAAIYLYSATFWCLHLMGVSPYVQAIMELFIHSYLLPIINIAFYMLLHYVMRKKMTARKSLQGQTEKAESGKQTQVQRNFVRVNLMLLAVLIACNTPSTVVSTIRLFMEDNKNVPSAKNLIANLMVDNVLYLKFLLDPFVYAWRMVKYREAFYRSIRRKGTGTTSHDSTRSIQGRETQQMEFSSAPSSGSVVTLLSFKSLEY